MKKIVHILIILFLIGGASFAQKEDRVWCFGIKAGIDFNELNDPEPIWSETDRAGEISASISNSNGELLFYLARINPSSSSEDMVLLDGQHQLLLNGNNIKSKNTFANGAVIIRKPEDSVLYYLFHVDLYGQSLCSSSGFCIGLYYSIIDMSLNNGKGALIKKNIPLFESPLQEGIAIVKHANGNDWWLLMHEQYTTSLSSCSNRFYKWLITRDTIRGPSYQDIGPTQCLDTYPIGELHFSKDGTLLSYVRLYEQIVGTFDFDRCNGELSNYRVVDTSKIQGFSPYSSEFSPTNMLLYVVSNLEALSGFGMNQVLQYDLEATNITASKTILYTNTTSRLFFGQLEIGPDNKIYHARKMGWNDYDSLNQFLGVISHPDSIGPACNYEPFSFYLGDSSRSLGGLPNMPNYDLGPTSIYEADAGENQVICSEDTTVKGVFIGGPAIPGMQYSWSPPDSLNHTDVSRPFAYPSQTTMYVLTLTDTSIRGSCQGRSDTVWVEVKSCAVGIEAFSSQHTAVRVFPNPAEGVLNVECLMMNACEGYELRLYDVLGKNLRIKQFENLKMEVDLSGLESGIYFYSIQSEHRIVQQGKLVIH